MMTPTIHLNGTAGLVLIEQLETACDRIMSALQALDDAAPNARDYYPQGEGAVRTAIAEHNARMDKLRSVYGELSEIINATADALAAREAQKAGRP